MVNFVVNLHLQSKDAWNVGKVRRIVIPFTDEGLNRAEALLARIHERAKRGKRLRAFLRMGV